MRNINKVYIYESFSTDMYSFMGTLFIDYSKGYESYSFEYDGSWLEKNYSLPSIDPDINPFLGRQYPVNKRLFGIIQDASPDLWGKMLMNRKEKMNASLENEKPRKLNDIDYLIGVYDETRMGGLRFKIDANPNFVSDDKDNTILPWTSLRSLEDAAYHFEIDELAKNDIWINQLIKPGSSLGGARPKACVVDTKGDIWIAKFPSKNDDVNVGAWEKVASDLASQCGLNVPESKIETFSSYGSTFLTKRFDRIGDKRIHYASALTLLGKSDGASFVDGSSYLDIATFIKSKGALPSADLKELWKRIVFFMAISNTDDHLRNHAFLWTKSGWRLSPLYDVNPTPYGDQLSLNISKNSNIISFDLALDVSLMFGIDKTDAKNIIENIKQTVKNNWEALANKYNLSREQIEYMRPAFSECYK